jgi:transposase
VSKQEVSASMLKHGRHYPRKKAWSMRYLRWLQGQHFDHLAHQIVLQEMLEVVRLAKERIERLEQTIEEFLPALSLAPIVEALRPLRGVDLIVAVILGNAVANPRIRA